MAKQPTYKFLPEDQCLSQSQLFDYIDGKLTSSEMHMAEKHILSCGFCSDALEGLEKVKDRDKVAAFIPFAKKEEEEEKPKVIPLNPNRKYYALVAGLVLIVAVSFLMKMVFNDNAPDSAKMADLSAKDSSVPESRKENQPGYRMADSISTGEASGKKDLASTDQQNKNAGPGDNRGAMAPSNLHTTYPAPVAAEEKVQPKPGDANADGEDRDNFVNIVDAEAAPDKEKDKADHYEVADKSLAKQEQSRVIAKNKKAKAAETKNADDNADAKAPAMDETQQDVVVNVPQTTISQTPSSANGASPTQVNGGTSSTYTWTPPVATGSSTTMSGTTPTTVTINTDSTTTVVNETETQVNLSYENGVKMLQAGQAAASLDMFDKVLKDPNNVHYSDAKWQKAEALIQLKHIPEAKALLNELAAKPGNYQQKAKDKLKTL